MSILNGLGVYFLVRHFLSAWKAWVQIPPALGLYALIGFFLLFVVAALRGFTLGQARPDEWVFLVLFWPLYLILFMTPGFGA